MTRLKLVAIKASAAGLIVAGLHATAAVASSGQDGTVRPSISATWSIFARHGADDPAGHDRGKGGKHGDDGPKHTQSETGPAAILLAEKGADDAPGHVRRSRGADDGVAHNRNGRGADDGADHDVGDDHGGRGGDDGAGHDAGDDHGGRGNSGPSGGGNSGRDGSDHENSGHGGSGHGGSGHGGGHS